MNTQPYQRLAPGGQVSAAEYNRLLQDVERLAGIKGPGLAVGSNGPKLREPDPWHLWGRVLTPPDDHGQYRCRQLDLTRQEARFAPRNRPGGLAWLPNILPAYEANHNPLVPVGSVVKLRRGVGDFWIFAHCCQELQSGSGAEESGSGSGEGSGSGSGHELDCAGKILLLEPGDGTGVPIQWTITGYTAGAILNCFTPAIAGTTGTMTFLPTIPPLYGACGVPTAWAQPDVDVPTPAISPHKALVSLTLSCCPDRRCICGGVAICVVEDGTGFFRCLHTGSFEYCGDLPLDIEFEGDAAGFGERLRWHITSP